MSCTCGSTDLLGLFVCSCEGGQPPGPSPDARAAGLGDRRGGFRSHHTLHVPFPLRRSWPQLAAMLLLLLHMPLANELAVKQPCLMSPVCHHDDCRF